MYVCLMDKAFRFPNCFRPVKLLTLSDLQLINSCKCAFMIFLTHVIISLHNDDDYEIKLYHIHIFGT